MSEKFTRFERARVIGARALQISMGAPIIVDTEDRPLHDPVPVAEMEYARGLIPITVLRPEGGHRAIRPRKEIVTGRGAKRETPRTA